MKADYRHDHHTSASPSNYKNSRDLCIFKKKKKSYVYVCEGRCPRRPEAQDDTRYFLGIELRFSVRASRAPTAGVIYSIPKSLFSMMWLGGHVCAETCTHEYRCPRRPEEGAKPCGPVIRGRCEPPDMGSQQGRYVFLTHL